MKIVLDTNVLVSAFISPHGAPALILRLILQGELTLVADSRILDEYREVLVRPRFGLPKKAVESVLAALREEAIMAPAYAATRPS
ncbi:MAG: putative toxin-antitoxin system toxin component, PIN family [Nitrospirae bacterium]|nr:putative toxin-antitoxin system toxin component, PIN family [Nitrospirota bacterium]MBI3392839.1 putative toxin-antitoxin system toxin component, PIN family [Nitrospirota bacterium]